MEYLIHLAILICIYGILGLSLNLIVGYTGLLSVTRLLSMASALMPRAFFSRHSA
jgi:ABC-type branched-subunit amino acid transport system permease subunit